VDRLARERAGVRRPVNAVEIQKADMFGRASNLEVISIARA